MTKTQPSSSFRIFTPGQIEQFESLRGQLDRGFRQEHGNIGLIIENGRHMREMLESGLWRIDGQNRSFWQWVKARYDIGRGQARKYLRIARELTLADFDGGKRSCPVRSADEIAQAPAWLRPRLIAWVDEGLPSGGVKAARGAKTLAEAEQKVAEYLKARDQRGAARRTLEERAEKAITAVIRVWSQQAREIGVAFDAEQTKKELLALGPQPPLSAPTQPEPPKPVQPEPPKRDNKVTPQPGESKAEETWTPPHRGQLEPAEVWSAARCPLCKEKLAPGFHHPEHRHDPICNYFQGKRPHVHKEDCKDNPLCTPRYQPPQKKKPAPAGPKPTPSSG